MSGLTIITDSSAYLPHNLTQELGIEVVPLQVIWEGKSYYDGVDILATEFYNRLQTADELPTTSAVSVHQFQSKIDELLKKDRSVLVLPISSGISASYANAVTAVNSFSGQPVEVIDTRLVSMALGFMALTAARAAKEGASLQQAADLARKTYSHIGVYFTVDDLKYLHKGGRIGSAKRLLGSALKIKPILQIQDGKIDAVGSAVTRKKALERLVKLVEIGIGTETPVHISVFHALAKDTALELQDICNQKFHPVENILSEVSPVVGSHVGPGTVSIAYMAGI